MTHSKIKRTSGFRKHGEHRQGRTKNNLEYDWIIKAWNTCKIQKRKKNSITICGSSVNIITYYKIEVRIYPPWYIPKIALYLEWTTRM